MPPYALLRCHVYNPGILPKHCSGAMSTILGFYLSTAQVPCLRSWDSTYALLRCHVYDPGILPMHCSGAMSTILGFYLCQLRGFTERMESISVLYTSTTWTFLMNWKTVMKRPTSLQFLKRSD